MFHIHSLVVHDGPVVKTALHNKRLSRSMKIGRRLHMLFMPRGRQWSAVAMAMPAILDAWFIMAAFAAGHTQLDKIQEDAGA
jgi:hypothetical protein